MFAMVSQLIDIEGGLCRTGNDYSFYIRHLRRFLNDTNMQMLCDALNRGDMKQSFFFAHTLKGVTAQLGIVALYHPLSALCDLLRTQDAAMLPQAQAALPELLALYDQVIREIETY